MKAIFGLLLVLTAFGLQAEDAQLEQLQEQLRKLQAEFERTQQQQRRQMEALQQQIETLKRAQTAQPPAAAPEAPAVPGPQTAEAPGGIRLGTPPGPLRLLSGQRGFLDLSFDGLFSAGTSTAEEIGRLQPGAHDPNQRGFTVQNLETTFEGMVDPYFRAQANIIFQIDHEGESILEVEEAFMQSLSLPWNLQLKAGQYFTEFGRLNPTHPHSWGFVDIPLVNARFLGADGLRNPGARLAWLLPTPFYSELFLSIQDSHGETAQSFRSDHEDELFLGRVHEQGRVKSASDLLFVPRYAISFDLTDSQTVLLGASAAFGPNGSGPDTGTQIFGLDFYWKWKPARHYGGFPFVSWQTELMWRRFEAAAFSADLDGDGLTELDLPRETLDDYGLYSQILYGFKRGWVAGLRGDYVAGEAGAFDPDSDRDRRWRISPNLTWYPSEFSKLRLQYNYDDREHLGVDHSAWLQFEFLLGTHGAHKF